MPTTKGLAALLRQERVRLSSPYHKKILEAERERAARRAAFKLIGRALTTEEKKRRDKLSRQRRKEALRLAAMLRPRAVKPRKKHKPVEFVERVSEPVVLIDGRPRLSRRCP